MRNETLQLALLLSGSGSTVEKIIKESQPGGVLAGKVNPTVVISSNKDVAGVEKARNLNVPVEIVSRKDFEQGKVGLEAFGLALLELLKSNDIDYVSQNGWLPLTPGNVVSEFEGRIFNQHPGPLDPDHVNADGEPLQFGGKGMHGKAVAAAVLKFQELSGRIFPHEATIHRVTTKIDGGAVVARKELTVFPNDTPETLSSRLLPLEHELQIKFWQKVYEGDIPDLWRDSYLINNNEEPMLFEAIVYARQQYPNG